MGAQGPAGLGAIPGTIVLGAPYDAMLTSGGYADLGPSSVTFAGLWRGTTVAPPEARRYHTAVWTGSELLVWGGEGSAGYLNTGGRYNPSGDSWRPTQRKSRSSRDSMSHNRRMNG